MNRTNAPGKVYPAVAIGPSPRLYSVDVVLTLVDGTEFTKNLKFRANDESQLKGFLAQTMQQIAMSGLLHWHDDKSEFVLDPAPSQIKSMRAHVPVIALATIGAN